MPFNNGQLPSLKDIFKNLVDELNRLLLIIWLITLIISLFTHTFILDLIPILIFLIFLYRLLSKNKSARVKENKMYLKFIKIITKPFNNLIRNFKDRHTYVYKKCPKCKTTLKLPLPNKRGINHAKCPNCGKRVTLFTLRKYKIEVIKKRRNNK